MTALILLSKFKETEIEIWRPLSDEPDYEVSNLGRLRSFRGLRSFGRRGVLSVRLDLPHLLSLNGRTEKGDGGYVKVEYGGAKNKCTTTMHALVARVFLPPCPPDCDQVNHKNGIKTDNRAANLEWSNTQRNQEHANAHLVKRGSQLPQARITESQVREVRRLRRDGWKLKAIALHLGISLNSVEQISAGSRWRHVVDG